MFGLKPSDIEAINSCFSKWPSIERVILYGSRAKGTHREGSDIDLVIESNHFSGNDLTSLSHDLDELNLPYKIDLGLKTQMTNSDLLEHIQRVGKIFYPINV
ncbi:nucleotidyltransferase domain-containing protein [Oscillatoria amoena NRMC-F 0135]|nr:nucleotidyltransferase domain-containing protein [Oscillatoria amoena NRMC-F 0135]